jgi:hypothetical protein
MRVKDEKLVEQHKTGNSRIVHYFVLFPTTVMLAISWLTVGALFLTHAETWQISTDTALTMKLVGGTALLFFSGIYFMQQLAGRYIHNQSRILYERNASAFASMKKAIDAHIEKRPETISQGDRPEA